MKNRYRFFYPIILLLLLAQFGGSIILSVNKVYDQLTFNLMHLWYLSADALTIYIFLKIYKTKLKDIFRVTFNYSIVINLFLCFIAGILLHTFNEWVYVLFPQLTELINMEYYEKFVSYTNNIPIFIYIGILVPIFEEIIYRGFFFRRCSYELGYKKVIFTCAIVFALLHLNLSQILYTFIIGIILNIVLLKTSNLFFTIAIHMGINIGGNIRIFKQLLESGVSFFHKGNNEPAVIVFSGILALICILIIFYIDQRYRKE